MNILDLDHSLTGQAPIAQRLASGRANRIDLLDLGPKLRLWSTEKTWKRFAERLAHRPRPTNARPEILFVGSGDYHHLTPAFLADLKEPVSLIHFDNHPDWVRLAPKRHCGSWVNRALKMPAIQRIVTLGPCSDDLHNPQLRGGNLGALKRGKLQLFPWQHPNRASRPAMISGWLSSRLWRNNWRSSLRRSTGSFNIAWRKPC